MDILWAIAERFARWGEEKRAGKWWTGADTLGLILSAVTGVLTALLVIRLR